MTTAETHRAVVATLDEARAAIEAARSSGAVAELESPPGAASVYGVLWFAEINRLLAAEFPGGAFVLELDCGDRADLAHAALARGPEAHPLPWPCTGRGGPARHRKTAWRGGVRMSSAKLVPELLVSDFTASLDFYVRLIGFTVRYDRPAEKFAYLDFDGAEIMIEQETDFWLTAKREKALRPGYQPADRGNRSRRHPGAALGGRHCPVPSGGGSLVSRRRPLCRQPSVPGAGSGRLSAAYVPGSG